MSTVDEKSIKVIEFSGKDLKIWSRKFCAQTNRKGYLSLLRGIQPILALNQYIAAEADPTDASNKTTFKIWKRNKLIWLDLTVSRLHVQTVEKLIWPNKKGITRSKQGAYMGECNLEGKALEELWRSLVFLPPKKLFPPKIVSMYFLPKRPQKDP